MWATIGNVLKWIFTILPAMWGAITYIAKAITDALEKRAEKKALENLDKALIKAEKEHDQRDIEKLFRK